MNDSQLVAKALNSLADIQAYTVGKQIRPSIAQRLLKSEQYKSFKRGSERVKFDLTPHEVKTAITGTGTINGPLTPSFTPSIDPGTRRALRIRDLLPVFTTENGAIEMPVKSAATNNAGSQNRENTTLGESAYTFTTSFIPVETIGHFVPVSKQIFEDAGTLDALINGELLHGLKAEEQDQLLNADGTASQLTGLIDNATAWANESPNITNKADILRSAIKQIGVADFTASAVVLNPVDAYAIDVIRSGASDDTYQAGGPRLSGPNLWDLPVIETNAIAAGTFLVADWTRAATLFDRQQAAIEIAQHDGENFQTGMLTLRALERLALVVNNPLALVTGSL